MRSDKGNQPPMTPSQLTKEFLSSALETEYGEPIQVASFRVQDADAGVLSHVVFIDVEYATPAEEKKDEETRLPPTKFVAKFLLPQFPLQQMFQVESNFYREHGTTESTSFQVPRPVYTSSNMIMVEHIASDRSFTAVEGCPKDLVLPIISGLAKFHSENLGLSSEELQAKCKGLATPAGVGSDLSGLVKETLFPGVWRDFLHNIPSLDDDVSAGMEDICHQLAPLRLRDLHNDIHNHPLQTMIHGDFHVANMLFQRDQAWLVDWATCGKGFPLIDLAFFAIVSLTPEVRREMEDDMLHAYHQALGPHGPPLDELKKLYRLCILNQWLILVGYDRLSREFVAPEAQRPEELAHHFDVVNARACSALLDCFGEDLLPLRKSKMAAILQFLVERALAACLCLFFFVRNFKMPTAGECCSVVHCYE